MITLKQYLTPDPNIRPPIASPMLIRGTRPSRGVRSIPLRQKFSSSGAFFVGDFKTQFESKLEFWAGLVYRARPDVTDIIDQPATVEFVDDFGEVHDHTLDFLIVRDDFVRVALVVKHSAMAAKTGIQRTVDLLAEQMSPAIADYVKLVTEKSFTVEDRVNAALIYSATRRRVPRDDATIDRLIRKLRGETRVGDLVEASRLDGYGFRAVVRAVADGRLRLIERCAIDDDTVVVRGPRNSG
jgi:hypothetical protein